MPACCGCWRSRGSALIACRAGRSSICSPASRACRASMFCSHRTLRRAATTPGRSSRASLSRSITCTCCPNGGHCFATGACSSASILEQDADIIITCARLVRMPSSVCPSSSLIARSGPCSPRARCSRASVGSRAPGKSATRSKPASTMAAVASTSVIIRGTARQAIPAARTRSTSPASAVSTSQPSRTPPG